VVPARDAPTTCQREPELEAAEAGELEGDWEPDGRRPGVADSGTELVLNVELLSQAEYGNAPEVVAGGFGSRRRDAMRGSWVLSCASSGEGMWGRHTLPPPVVGLGYACSADIRRLASALAWW
jgi:hypothetical protein